MYKVYSQYTSFFWHILDSWYIICIEDRNLIDCQIQIQKYKPPKYSTFIITYNVSIFTLIGFAIKVFAIKDRMPNGLIQIYMNITNNFNNNI